MSKKKLASVIIAFIGGALVVASFLTFALINARRDRCDGEREELLIKLKDVMPNIADIAPDDRGITSMSGVEINGTDLVGIIELPDYGRELPVAGSWSQKGLSTLPHRYSGSVHNGSFIIGGSSRKGQFDFMKIISIGDPVYFTDVDGGRYSFKVSDIKITKDISYDYLEELQADLILFAGNLYSFDKTVIICSYD